MPSQFLTHLFFFPYTFFVTWKLVSSAEIWFLKANFYLLIFTVQFSLHCMLKPDRLVVSVCECMLVLSSTGSQASWCFDTQLKIMLVMSLALPISPFSPFHPWGGIYFVTSCLGAQDVTFKHFKRSVCSLAWALKNKR